MAKFPTRQRPSKPKATSPTFIQRSREKGAGEKATYHNITGAGKSRVVRRFLGLTDQDAQSVKQKLVDGLRRQLKAG